MDDEKDLICKKCSDTIINCDDCSDDFVPKQNIICSGDESEGYHFCGEACFDKFIKRKVLEMFGKGVKTKAVISR